MRVAGGSSISDRSKHERSVTDRCRKGELCGSMSFLLDLKNSLGCAYVWSADVWENKAFKDGITIENFD